MTDTTPQPPALVTNVLHVERPLPDILASADKDSARIAPWDDPPVRPLSINILTNSSFSISSLLPRRSNARSGSPLNLPFPPSPASAAAAPPAASSVPGLTLTARSAPMRTATSPSTTFCRNATGWEVRQLSTRQSPPPTARNGPGVSFHDSGPSPRLDSERIPSTESIHRYAHHYHFRTFMLHFWPYHRLMFLWHPNEGKSMLSCMIIGSGGSAYTRAPLSLTSLHHLCLLVPSLITLFYSVVTRRRNPPSPILPNLLSTTKSLSPSPSTQTLKSWTALSISPASPPPILPTLPNPSSLTHLHHSR